MDEWKVAITCRKLTSQAKVQLVDKDIPTELAKILNHTNADSCKKSIDIVEKAFQTAVEKAVEEKYFKTSYVDIKHLVKDTF